MLPRRSVPPDIFVRMKVNADMYGERLAFVSNCVGRGENENDSKRMVKWSCFLFSTYFSYFKIRRGLIQ